jgi:hypothetical protein
VSGEVTRHDGRHGKGDLLRLACELHHGSGKLLVLHSNAICEPRSVETSIVHGYSRASPTPPDTPPPRRPVCPLVTCSTYTTQNLHVKCASTLHLLAAKIRLRGRTNPLPSPPFATPQKSEHASLENANPRPKTPDPYPPSSPRCHPQKQVTTNIATFYSTSAFNFTIINIP